MTSISQIINTVVRKFAVFTAGKLTSRQKQKLYKLGPFSNLIRSLLNRSVPIGIHQVNVEGGPLKNMRLRLDLQTEKNYWLGTYEPEVQELVRSWIKPGWVVYDVGANIGYISLMLALAVGIDGEVHAFEALPENFERLKTNLKLNSLQPKMVINHNAVVGKSGKISFLMGPSGAMGKAEGSAGRQFDYRASITVKGITLDDYIYIHGNPEPNAIKMDIEGGEILALKGMPHLLSDARPIIFLELHGPEAANTAWEILHAHNYEVRSMKADKAIIRSVEELDWKAYLTAVPISE